MAKRASGDRLDGLSSRDLKEVELARIQAAKEVKLSRHFAFIRVAPNLERLGVGGLIVWSLSLLPKIPIEWSPTIENLVKEWLAPVGFGIGGLCLCVTAIVLRRAGRRRASIEHTQTVALETELDAKRSSSQMPPTGTTREGD